MAKGEKEREQTLRETVVYDDADDDDDEQYFWLIAPIVQLVKTKTEIDRNSAELNKRKAVFSV